MTGYFMRIAASIAIAQIGGMIAVPDVPLLFFVSLVFFAVQAICRQHDDTQQPVLRR